MLYTLLRMLGKNGILCIAIFFQHLIYQRVLAGPIFKGKPEYMWGPHPGLDYSYLWS